MSACNRRRFWKLLRGADVFAGVHVLLALLPMVSLGMFWLGGQMALIALATGLALGVAVVVSCTSRRPFRTTQTDSATGLLLREGFEQTLSELDIAPKTDDLHSACLVIEIDDSQMLLARHGQAVMDQILRRGAERIIGAIRASDHVARLGECRFAVCLRPVINLDLELGLQLAARIQAALEEPMHISGTTHTVSSCIGFCLNDQLPSDPPVRWLEAATTALQEAQKNGPSSIRAFTADMDRRNVVTQTLHKEAIEALEAGDIQPWFQPQLCTDTGMVSGFEALARWITPNQGALPPDRFIPALEMHRKMERLREVMLRQSLEALRDWDAAGLDVPNVAINLTQQDLSNPRLFEHIAWELDRFDLEPSRLCIEILETVMSDNKNPVVLQNIERLSRIGCPIDLDDYGTGHASIAALHKFPVQRIKIDRSFVLRADKDPAQQRILSALLVMAERLDLETLAEGVETAGEHAFLAQLGCSHVQGFAIGRPMPASDVPDWLHRHNARLRDPPLIGRKTG